MKNKTHYQFRQETHFLIDGLRGKLLWHERTLFKRFNALYAVVSIREAAINRVCEDIKDKKAGSGADKLDSLSKLVNSYSRLIERDKQKEIDPNEDGDPAYYKKMTADKTDMRGIIR